MANIALSVKEFKNSLFFVSVTTILIGSFAGLVRYFVFGNDVIPALTLGLLFSVSWTIAISIWAFQLSWKSQWLAKLTGRPIIQGIWFGHLHTNYDTNDEGETKAIPIAFVIKQTYLGYSLLSYTENQDSRTLVESLSIDDQHEIIQLRYMYEFYIRKPNERKLTTGAAELKLFESGKRLIGQYMTNSPTQVFADLSLVQRSCDGIDTFSAVKKLYQNKHAKG